MSDDTQTSAQAATGPDVPPDRLAISPASPFFDADRLQRGVGIRFKGTVRTNIDEYCISEGWVRVQAGKTMDRKGQPLTIKLTGPVEAWYEDLGDDPPVAKPDATGDSAGNSFWSGPGDDSPAAGGLPCGSPRCCSSRLCCSLERPRFPRNRRRKRVSRPATTLTAGEISARRRGFTARPAKAASDRLPQARLRVRTR